MERTIEKVYHGTPFGDFNEFCHTDKRNTNNETNNLGFWFTNNREVAESFSVMVGTELVEGEDKWEDGSPKYYYKDKNLIGGLHRVNLNWRNPMIFESPKINKEELEKEIEKLKEQRNKISLEVSFCSDYKERRNLISKEKEIEKQIKEIRKQIKNDSFELFMDYRDQFCIYISSNQKGTGSWRERYILMNKEEANQELIEHLKGLGYDGIWLKNTVYDSPDDNPIDQYIVFDNLNIEKLDYIPLESYIDKEKLSSIINEKKNSFTLF